MLLMIGITVVDVILRLFNTGITGAYDLVQGPVVQFLLPAGLPYLTAVKGHIAIEFFYLKSNRIGRIIMDTIIRVSSMAIFGVLAYHTFRHGLSLFDKGEVFPNLGLPVFWIPILISINSVLMIVVFIYHMIHPGKEYIKP